MGKGAGVHLLWLPKRHRLGVMDFPLTLIWQGQSPWLRASRREAPRPLHLGFFQKSLRIFYKAMPSTESESLGSWRVGPLSPALSFKSSHHRYCVQTLNVYLDGFNQELEGWLCDHHNFRTSLSPQSNSSLPLPTCLPSCGAPVLFQEAALRHYSDVLSLRNWPVSPEQRDQVERQE